MSVLPLSNFVGSNQRTNGVQVRETKDDIHVLFYELPLACDD